MQITQVLVIFSAIVINLKSISARSASNVRQREKRFLAYPINSAIGMVVAIAVPLDLPHRNVFVSYNFEGNYNMPTTASDLVPGPLVRLDLVDRALGRNNDKDEPIWSISVTEPYNVSLPTKLSKECENDRELKDEGVKESGTTTTEEVITESPKVTKSPHKRDASDSLMTRKKVYKMLESKLQNHGHPGKPCLLRAICEEAEQPINEHNGVIGDIIHIILTPSTSDRENLHPEYNRAEYMGRSGDCSKYKKYCSQSIINYISKVIPF